MYRSRVWIVLVPGKRWSAIESRIAPSPSSSRLSFSWKRAMMRCARWRSASSKSIQAKDDIATPKDRAADRLARSQITPKN